MTERQIRCYENNRIVYYREQADADYWDHHWQAHDGITPELYSGAQKGNIGLVGLNYLLKTYLPTEGKILEAGCGRGQFVVALRARGYDAEGVDFASETIDAIQRIYPELPVFHGDVLNLNVPDDTYTGYISLGVVEHREAGPDPFLQEAYRILAPGGRAFIAVPGMHPVRRLKSMLGAYRSPACSNPDRAFYQYVYSRDELTAIIRRTGFDIIDASFYDAYKGLKDEIALIRTLLTRSQGFKQRFRRLSRHPRIDTRFGHMLMVVAEK